LQDYTGLELLNFGNFTHRKSATATAPCTLLLAAGPQNDEDGRKVLMQATRKRMYPKFIPFIPLFGIY